MFGLEAREFIPKQPNEKSRAQYLKFLIARTEI
jgi:hypothetical protein